MIVELVFIALLIVAAVSDLATYRIPNSVVLAFVVLFAIVVAINGLHEPWPGHLAAAALSLAACLGLYAFRQMGAGDVKLIAAISLWTGFPALVPFAVFVGLAGLVVLTVILGVRYGIVVAERHSLRTAGAPLPRVFRRGEGIPYATAICMGAAAAIPWFSPWLWP